MTPYSSSGSWSGNYQLEYQSSAISDYITFQTYYDQWLESNFNAMTHSNTEVTGTNPVLTVMSRENQGLATAWNASAQTTADGADNPSDVANKTIRNFLSGANFTQAGNMVRFKFMASTSGTLHITSAYFGLGSSGSPNFSGATTQLYVNNAPVAPGGSDVVGATGVTGPTDITIFAGNYVWSNWMPIDVTAGSNYLLSFTVENAVSNGNETYWNPGGASDISFLMDAGPPTADWAGGYATDVSIHALSDVATWINNGTASSQIYDTHVTAPVYDQLTWTTNGSGTYLVKVRSSNDSQMTGATAWSLIAGCAASPCVLAGVGSGRYVQFQATLTAESPYTTYPQLDNVTITWPGQTAIVEFSGQYTKRSNYGIFTVKVDGATIVNALQVDLSASKNYQGKTQNLSLSTELKPRNTGK